MNTQLFGVNILDILGELQLEKMGVYALEMFAKDCHSRAILQPDNDRGCWLTEIYIELANQAIALRNQRFGDRDL